MIHILPVTNWWPFKLHQEENRYSSALGKTNVVELDQNIELDGNNALAILAYGEIIEHMDIGCELIDSLLVEEMTNILNNNRGQNELYDPQNISKSLLPTAKEVLHKYYSKYKKYSNNCEDICRCVHNECDIEFLKFITHIYARAFIKQFYWQECCA